VPQETFSINIDAQRFEDIVGIKIGPEVIINSLKKLGFSFSQSGSGFKVTIPNERLDLRLTEDLVEEILKVYGYDKIPGKLISKTEAPVVINKSFYYSSKIKQILIDQGFSEIYGYIFSKVGQVELANSVAPEKKFLRDNLSSSMSEYLEFNTRYAELVSMPQVKIFEISKIFKPDREENSLVLGVKTPAGTKNIEKDEVVLTNALEEIKNKLNLKDFKDLKFNPQKNIVELDFEDLLSILPDPTTYDIELPRTPADMRFKKISIYPFSVRDVSVFTPEGTTESQVVDIIKREAGSLLVRYRLFDVFTKKIPDGKSRVSYGFRLVLQSQDKTLSEEDINQIMQKVSVALNSQVDWQVR
jgi:phenylalanyl-tRNA synthetase beta chain